MKNQTLTMQGNIQLSHNDHLTSEKKFPLRIIANDIVSPLNVGSLFRLCDALGIEKLYLCGNTPTPPNNRITKTARSTEKHVTSLTEENTEQVVNNLKEKSFLIVSLEITSQSIALNSVEFQRLIRKDKPVCMIIGSEKKGVNQKLLSLSDVTVHIPMFGNNSSMNVVTAASIACYAIINQKQLMT